MWFLLFQPSTPMCETVIGVFRCKKEMLTLSRIVSVFQLVLVDVETFIEYRHSDVIVGRRYVYLLAENDRSGVAGLTKKKRKRLEIPAKHHTEKKMLQGIHTYAYKPHCVLALASDCIPKNV